MPGGGLLGAVPGDSGTPAHQSCGETHLQAPLKPSQGLSCMSTWHVRIQRWWCPSQRALLELWLYFGEDFA